MQDSVCAKNEHTATILKELSVISRSTETSFGERLSFFKKQVNLKQLKTICPIQLDKF